MWKSSLPHKPNVPNQCPLYQLPCFIYFSYKFIILPLIACYLFSISLKSITFHSVGIQWHLSLTHTPQSTPTHPHPIKYKARYLQNSSLSLLPPLPTAQATILLLEQHLGGLLASSPQRSFILLEATLQFLKMTDGTLQELAPAFQSLPLSLASLVL